MRTTALPSLLETLARNNSHRNPSAKVYEVAKVYLPLEGQALCDEKQFISLGGYGGDLDFFQFKGAVETIFDSFHIQGVKYTAARRNPSYHPGRCAVLSIDSTVVGVMGQIHPLVCKNYDVEQPMFAAEIDFDALLRARPTAVRYRPLPKFPAVERDIAVVCDRGIPVSDLEDCIRRGGHGLIQEIQLFDIYTGKPIPEDKKSVAFALKLRHEDHTLTDAEADSDVKAVLALLQEELGAVLR